VTWLEALAVVLAGLAAGTINTVVGSGTLITFPTLLALGYPPVVANISNNVGLVPGGVSGTWGYRSALAGQRRRLYRLVPLSVLGAATGAMLLLVLPAAAFETIVPLLIALALVLVLVQPSMQRALAARHARRGTVARDDGHPALVMPGVALTGVYGGYFGAAQGVLLVGLLGSLLPETLQRINAAKNLLALVANLVAAVVFCAVAFDRIDWVVAGLVALGSVVGGVVGARVGLRLPPVALRAVIVVVGSVAIVRMVA
jgi:uncharacterized protein